MNWDDLPSGVTVPWISRLQYYEDLGEISREHEVVLWTAKQRDGPATKRMTIQLAPLKEEHMVYFEKGPTQHPETFHSFEEFTGRTKLLSGWTAENHGTLICCSDCKGR